MNAMQTSFRIGFAALALALSSVSGWADDPARSADPAAASFERMLAHTPTRHTPEAPRGEPADPLIAALALPLLRDNAVAVAGVATPRR